MTLLALLRHHLRRSDRARRRELVGQRTASVTLYPTSGRQVLGTPQRRPSSAQTLSAVTHQETTDEQRA